MAIRDNSFARNAAPTTSITFSKRPFIEDAGPRKIKSIHFTTMSGPEIVKAAELHVYESNLFVPPDRRPCDHGILDTRLGPSYKTGECTTCHGKFADCPGHFGYIKLALPVFHIGYFKNIINLLQCICKSCARILCPEDERRVFLRRMRNPRAEVLQKRALLKKITERCKRVHICTHCGDYNGTVKKLTSTLRIAHEKYSKVPDVRNDYQSELMEAVKQNKEIKPYLNKIQDDLTPIKVLNLFERMTDEESFGMAGL